MGLAQELFHQFSRFDAMLVAALIEKVPDFVG